MTASSPILAALYRHAFEEAAALAEGVDLTLWESAALGQVESLARLEALGVDLDQPAPDGFTPLHLACYFGHTKAAEWLLDHGADPRAAAPGAVQPLHSAAASPNPEAVHVLVKALLFAGADVNAIQRGGFTALHAAAQRGSRELAEALLEAGADPSLLTDRGESVLDLALAREHTDWIEWFRARS